MEITCRYFAAVRESVGKPSEVLTLPDGASSEELMDALAQKYNVVAELRPQIRVAVNETMLHQPTSLNQGDEVALIPPVSGG